MTRFCYKATGFWPWDRQEVPCSAAPLPDKLLTPTGFTATDTILAVAPWATLPGKAIVGIDVAAGLSGGSTATAAPSAPGPIFTQPQAIYVLRTPQPVDTGDSSGLLLLGALAIATLVVILR